MYAIDELKRDVARTELMLKVVEDFTDGSEFTVKDIDESKRKNYAPSLHGCGVSKADFTGASMDALCRRGLAEVVKTEDYIYTYKDYGRERKAVGTRTIYRLTGKTIEDYKAVMSKAISLAVCGCQGGDNYE